MKKPHQRSSRRAFTVLEVLVVSGLTVMLAMVLGSAWSGFGRPLIEATARATIAQDANLAAASLARDFGGSLASSEGRLGDAGDGNLVGRMQPDGTILRLCFDGGTPPNGLADWADPDTVISYQLQDNNLIRWDENSGAMFTVARNVQDFELIDQGNGVEIKITFTYRNITRTYSLVGLDP